MLRATFLMEQHVGHQTYYQNLRQFADHQRDVVNTWVPITYQHESRLVDLAPGLSDALRGTLQGALQVYRALDPTGYDVAFFNTQVPAALAGARLGRQPYVIATNITPIQYDQIADAFGHRPDRTGPLARYKHRINRLALTGAARVLPWSRWAQESLVRDYGVAAGRIDIVAPGVDLRMWRPSLRRADRPMRILFVGGDLYRKGGATLLEAFRSLSAGLAELHLVTRTRIQPEAGVRTYYTLQPNSPELIALYRASDVFALPTEAEPFGIAAAEACAAGIALITTSVGGLADIVADDENGFIVPPRDPAALRALLLLLAEDPARRVQMGRAARARAERSFDAEANAARIVGHLRAAAGEPPIKAAARALPGPPGRGGRGR